MQIANALRVGAIIRRANPQALIVWGGAHPTFFPEMVFEDDVDVICVGEGEAPFAELLQAVDAGSDFSRIRNLWVKQRDGTVVKNETRPFIQDLDQLLYPERGIFRKISGFDVRNDRSVTSGRGCPFDCLFCYNHLQKKIQSSDWVRLRSVSNVIGEMAEVRRRYPVQLFLFHDDAFGFKVEWLSEFARVYPREIGIPYQCQTRADYLDEPRVRLLKASGCCHVNLGLEAGNEQIRNGILQKKITNNDVIQATRLLHKYKIPFGLLNMAAYPGETLETLFETIKLNIKCHPAAVHMSFFYPFPKLKLTQVAIDQGLCSESAYVPEEAFAQVSLDLPAKDDIQFFGCMIFLLVEFPFLFWLAQKVAFSTHPRFKLLGKTFFLGLDRWLERHPRRKGNKRLYRPMQYLAKEN